MKITIISGSPRHNSLTRRVATFLKNRMESTTEHEIEFLDIRDNVLPPVQSVFTSIETTPREWKHVSETIFSSDAFIIVSPEYNGSYSPALKNLLDHYPKQHRKPFGIVTASPGAMGGIRAAQQMQNWVSAMFGIYSPYMLVVPFVDKKFDADGNLVDEAFEHTTNNFVTEFLWLAEQLVEEKVMVPG